MRTELLLLTPILKVSAIEVLFLSCIIVLYYVFLLCMHSFVNGRRSLNYKEFKGPLLRVLFPNPKNAKIKKSLQNIPIACSVG